VNHKYVVLFGQCDDALEEVQFDALGGRVGRKAQDHHLWLGDRAANGFFQLGEEVHARHQRHGAHLRASNDCTVDVNRITGVRYQHGVALVEGGEHQVCQALFGADGDDGFAFRVDIDLVARFVPA
jgi:hypothetical protein